MLDDDIVTRLRESKEVNGFDSLGGGYRHLTIVTPAPVCAEAADEIERLRRERLEWFLVARQLRDAVMAKQEVDEAINDYLRVRGSLEDPRDAVEEVTGE